MCIISTGGRCCFTLDQEQFKKVTAMKIGILQTGHAPEELQPSLGNYDAMFERLLSSGGFTFETFHVVDMEFPAGAHAADGWLITGSKHGAYEDHAWIPPLEALIREIRAADLPLIGVCFGHQIIAQALGGRVEKFSGGWSIGRTAYQIGPKTLHLNAWHQDQVVALPKGATVEASSDICENAVLSYGDKVWTIQPHPEFGAEMIGGLIKYRGSGVVPDALLNAAQTQLTASDDSAEIAQMMINVLRGEPAL